MIKTIPLDFYKFDSSLVKNEPIKSVLAVIENVTKFLESHNRKQVRIYGSNEDPKLPGLLQLNLLEEKPYPQEFNVFTIFFNNLSISRILSDGNEFTHVDINDLNFTLAEIIEEYNVIYHICDESELISKKNEDSSFSSFLNFRDIPRNFNTIDFFQYRMNREDEIRLFNQLSQGDLDAFLDIFIYNLKTVNFIAKKHTVISDPEYEVLYFIYIMYVGSKGLLKAIDTFRTDKNIKFSTYASRCIENEILIYLNSNKSLDHTIGEILNIHDQGFLDANKKYYLENKDINSKVFTHKTNDMNYLDSLDDDEREVITKKFKYYIGDKKWTSGEIAKQLGINKKDVDIIEERALFKLMIQSLFFEYENF
ncbi:sigma factor-like helix-turn-helix DNA-binding protein [Paenibacillus sp. FSL L8-0708]|uniref:sigma factor-like helix-turn-helix DNA-binding protein n=1 Tax=Paenibacillus sp. FSL L8-0708 TaxID=2975311 RepID=UPI0030F82361